MRSSAVCGDGTIQNPNTSGVKEICDSGTNNGKSGYCDKTCSCMLKNWYGDNDGDGFGSTYTVVACTKPAGKFSDKPGDLNDSSLTMYPGAPELCDGLDNNQNGPIDEGVQVADDGNFCTDDFCMGGKIVHSNNKKPCSDNNVCTSGDVCSAGKCGGAPVAVTYTYSEWWKCQADGTQVRTVLSTSPAGCKATTPPVLMQACTPLAPPPPVEKPWPGQKNVAVGQGHICAISEVGTMSAALNCWGDNTMGQLGNGQSDLAINPIPTKAQLAWGDIPISVAAGFNSTCSLLSSGTVKCWGGNSYGQLGYTTQGSLYPASATPKAVTSITTAKKIATGGNAACAILATGTVKCWGLNYGVLPVDIQDLANVIDVAVSNHHACALVKGGAVKCWGENNYGGLGNNSFADSKVPVTALVTQPAVAIVGGLERTCAITTGGLVQCWGYKISPDKEVTSAPVAINKPNVSVAEVALGGDHTCFLSPSGYTTTTPTGPVTNTDTLCVGNNLYGQLGVAIIPGDDPAANFYTNPIKVPISPSVTSIVAGEYITCATIPNTASNTSSLKCWGDASHGELGFDPKVGGKKSNFSSPSKPVYYADAPTSIPNLVVMSTEKTMPPSVNIGPSGVQADGCKAQWYFAKDVTHIYGPYTGCADIPDTIDGDPQKWCATAVTTFANLSNVYISGKSQGTNWKYCTTETPSVVPGDGGKSQLPLDQQWAAHKAVIPEFMNALVKATMDLAAARVAYEQETLATIETPLKELLNGKKTPPPPGTKIIPSKAAYDGALQKQKDALGNLNTVLMMIKTDPKLANPNSVAEVAMAYLNAFLTLSVNGPLIDPKDATCSNDPIYNQHIFKNDPWQFSLMVRCLPWNSVEKLDHGLITAFYLTMQVVKAAQPTYADSVRDMLLPKVARYALPLNEVMRHKGAGVASSIFLKLYADRFSATTGSSSVTSDTKVNLEPANFSLYNPGSKKEEPVILCGSKITEEIMDPKKTPPPPNGELAVWSDKYGCMIFKNFVKIANPATNKSLTCDFWSTARVGKPCVTPPLATSLLERVRKLVERLLISEAYASEAPSCETAEFLPSSGYCTYMGKGPLPTPQNYPKFAPYCCFKHTDGTGGTYCVKDDTCAQFCNCEVEKNSICGDGKTGPGEACDDGNAKDGDGCSSTCKKEDFCGDKVVSKDDECDDGNTIDTDACTTTCENARCGDTFRRTDISDPTNPLFEACDDGNTNDNDSCSTTCKWCPACQPDKLPECVSAKEMFGKALSGKQYTLGPWDVNLLSVKPVCQIGMPISCLYSTYRKACDDAVAVCRKQKSCGEDPALNDLKTKICPAINKSAIKMDMVYALLEGKMDGNYFENSIVESNKSLDAFSNKGVNKLLGLFPVVTQWLEYYSGKKFTEDEKVEALSAAVWTLRKTELMTDPELIKKAAASTDPSGSKSGWTIQVDPLSLAQMTDESAAIAGAHEALHVVTGKLLANDDGPASKALEKVVADANKMDSSWYEQLKDKGGFTAHWVLKLLEENLGKDWMFILDQDAQTKTNFCDGY